MRARILVVLALCAAVIAAAQTGPSQAAPRSLSLQQCIQLALTHNLDVQIERLTAGIAGFSLGAAYGAYDPTLSFSARRDYINEPADFDARKFNDYFPAQLTTDTVGPSLTGLAPIGLSYNFNGRVGNQSAITDFSSDPEDASFYPGGIRRTNDSFADVGVTLTQHLLKDFWIDQQREVIRVRRTELKMSEQSLRFEIMKIILAVEVGYYDFLAAREEVRVQEKALELRQQFVAETHRRVEVGDLPPLDAEQAETQLQNTLTALTAAREVYVARQNALKALLTEDFRDWVDTDVLLTDALLALPAELKSRRGRWQTRSIPEDVLGIAVSDFQQFLVQPVVQFLHHWFVRLLTLDSQRSVTKVLPLQLYRVPRSEARRDLAMNERRHLGGFRGLRESLRHLCEEVLQFFLAEGLRLQAGHVRLRQFDRLQYPE